MKKIILAIAFTFSFALFAEDCEFTWAKYENLCWKNGKEPSYEEYEYLAENPQCFGFSEIEELEM